MPLGDIIIYDDNDEKLVIERKCLNDLLASIKDGRYEEQSYRLNGLNHPNHNIYYLIEGDVNKANRFKDNNIEKLTLYSAMFSLNYYKGFSVYRSDNVNETAYQIPGISSVTAIAIMDKFKTIPNLINEIHQNDNCLKDISYQNSKGQSRKINKTSLANIVKFLLKK